MTYQEVSDEFARVGVSLGDIPTDALPRLDVEGRDDDSRLVLVVTTLARNDHGGPYVDRETGKIATEVRRFPVRVAFEVAS